MSENDNFADRTEVRQDGTALTAAEDSRKEFPIRLRAAMPEWNQEAFAHSVGASLSGLKKWLAGKSEPGMGNLVALSVVTGVTTDWLTIGKVDTAADAEAEDRYLRLKLKQAELLGDSDRVPAIQALVTQNLDLLRVLRRQQDVQEMLWDGRPRQVSAITPQAAAFNGDALTGAIVAVEELLAARGLSMPPEKKAKLVGLVYRQLTKDGAEGEIESGYIDTLIDLAS